MRVLVLGGGPAGVSAALQAAELGAEVTLVERRRVGGTAVNEGPAPVRTVARAARLVRDWSSWERFGLRGSRPEVDLAATLANADRVARYAHERKQLAAQIRAMGVELIEGAGDASFRDATTVVAPDGRSWSADRIIIAVGGRASRLPIPGAELGMTFEDVRRLSALPGRVCIIGAADTGCQLASILADFGCRVSLIEYAPRIVPRADRDVSAGLETAFRDRGIDVTTRAHAERVESLEPGVRVVYTVASETRNVDVDAVFFAVGWPSNADLVDAAAAGVAIERGYVVVDEYQRTSVPHIFAAGDVDGNSMLVASARLEGLTAAENAVLGARRRIAHDVVPVGSFTNPEYASVGLTEEQARDRDDCAVAVARYENMLRPVADGQPDGFCKLIVETGRRQIVGAHVLGEYSAEVIQVVAACMAGAMRVEQVAEMQYAYPTFTEGVQQAAQMLVRQLGVGAMPVLWSSLRTTDETITSDALPSSREQHVLGEGARWDRRRNELLRVDIIPGRVHRDTIADDGSLVRVRDYRLPETVGAIAPIEGDDGWLLAAGRAFAHLSPDGSLRTLAEVAAEGTRMNDAACDPQGRFWVGTLADDHHEGGGALYRLERDGRTELVLDGLTISNGLGWSPDGATMYLVDSGPRVIHTFDFDGDTGTISNGRVLVAVDESLGTPDGLTVDAAGDIWVAIYGGGRVRRYTPDGALREELHVPARQTTSCAFAGVGLHRLYVTTATENWSAEQRRADPTAGIVYRFETTATGRPAEPFRPDPAWWAAVVR